MTPGRRIYIIGFMGSGKTTAGKKLASRLKWQFIDLDREIELRAGKSINDIFSSEGEDHFRKIESKTLTEIKPALNAVISTGGGTPCYGKNMDFMISTGIVVYLRMTPFQLKNRLEREAATRPLIKDIGNDELLRFISDKLIEREKYYHRATLVVNGIDLDIEVLGDKIKEMLRN